MKEETSTLYSVGAHSKLILIRQLKKEQVGLSGFP
jgi:hypothetical protein